MSSQFRIGSTSWIDIESPSRDDIRDISLSNNIDFRIAEELVSNSPFPSYRRGEDTLFLSLFFPALRHSHTEEEIQEVDFILKDNFLLTARYDSIDAFHKFKKELEVVEASGHADEIGNSLFLFNSIIKKLYKSLRHEIEYVLSDIQRIEREIFSGDDKNLIKEISDRSRLLLSIRRTLSLNYSALDLMYEDALKHNPPLADVLVTLKRNHKKTLSLAEDTLDSLRELRETNSLLVTVRQNDVMKILTIMSSVTLPLTLMSGIFGMNVVRMPIVGGENAFAIILVAMAVISLLFISYFAYKKWL